jgi:alanine dehydrogenase
MDATEITAYRTAAASAIASKYLARPDARTLGIIGTGRQAYMHLQSHAQIFSLEAVKVYGRRPEAVEAFISYFPRFKVEGTSVEEALASDIVCTVTPATAPLVRASWVRPGTHINAVGADAQGKCELDPDILRMARVVVDDMAQSCHSGEINVALSQGLFKREQICATLGEIITNTRPGRESAQEITVFDSTGLAIEDAATAHLIYQKARERGGYLSVDIV